MRVRYLRGRKGAIMSTVKWAQKHNLRAVSAKFQAGVSAVKILLAVSLVLISGCAMRYKAGDTCWSAEMVSTEDWCEKQRVIEKVSRDSLAVHDHRSPHNDYPFRQKEQP